MFWVAHRGESFDAPENTLAAFRLAWERGVKAVEGDFRLTRDGRVVCAHDASTARVCGVDVAIADTDYAELARLDAGAGKGPSFSGEKIPLLEEVLDSMPSDGKLLLEIKSGPATLEPVRRILSRSGIAPEQVALICFDPEVLRQARQLAPEFKRLLLGALAENDDLANGLTHLDTLSRMVESVGADGVDLRADPEMITRDLVARFIDAGLEFHVWIVDTEEKADYFTACGVTSITSNRAAFLKSRHRKKTTTPGF